ncbi:MAG: DUF2079 domain-containing protein [Patescibacteria group bacterium]|nr:DUF2079 domain-containing protein [Patescibacteria group bacterium]
MITQPKDARGNDRRAMYALIFACLIYVALFSAIAAWKFFNFRYNAIDLAIFTQAVSRTAAGDWFGLSIHPPSYLGDHFSPALALLAIPFRVFPHPLTLLIALQIALAAGAWPVYRLARGWFSPAASLALGVAYLISPFTQNLSLFEFHFIAFAVPLVLSAAAAYQRKNFRSFFIWSALALLIREDAALIIGAFALLSWLERRPRRWVVTPLAMAVVWMPLAFLIIHSASVTGNYKYGIYYAWLWPAIFSAPWSVLGHFLQIGNFEMIAGMLLPFAFLPLLAPAALILAVAPLAQILLGAPGGGDLILKTQYIALFLPALWISFCRTLGNFQARPQQRPRWLKIFFTDPRLGVLLLAVAVGYASLTLGPLPGTVGKILAQGWQPEGNRWQMELVARIPPNAPAAASYAFLPALASRPQLASLNYAFIGHLQLSRYPYELPPETQYILADLSEFLTYQIQYGWHFLYAQDYPGAAARLRQRLARDGFAVTAIAGSTALLERGGTDAVALYRILDQAPTDLHRQPVATESGLQFLGWRAADPAPGPVPADRQLPLTLYWRTELPQKQPYYWQLTVAGKAITPLYPLGNGLLPATDWPVGAIVETNSWTIAPDVPPDQDIALKLVTVQAGGLYLAPDLATELRIERSQKISPAIPLGTLAELTGRP